MVAAAVIAVVALVLVLLGLAKARQDKEAGRQEVELRDALAQAKAATRMEELAREGQGNEETQADLDAGKF